MGWEKGVARYQKALPTESPNMTHQQAEAYLRKIIKSTLPFLGEMEELFTAVDFLQGKNACKKISALLKEAPLTIDSIRNSDLGDIKKQDA